jgi:hypothetical protein
MLRTIVGALVAFVLVCGVARAGDVKGKVKSVNAEKSTILLVIGEKEQTFAVAKNVVIEACLGKNITLKDIKPGTFIELITGKEKDKEVVLRMREDKEGKKNAAK